MSGTASSSTSTSSRLHAADPRAAAVFRLREKTALEPRGNGGGPVVDAELGVDVQQVGLDGCLADEQALRTLPVGRAAGDQSQYVEFALAERRFGCAHATHQTCRHGRGEDRLTSCGRLDGAHELVA